MTLPLATGNRSPLCPFVNSVLDKNEPDILHAGDPEIGSSERTILLLDFAQSVCLVPLRVGNISQGLTQAMGLLILGGVAG